MRNARLIFMLHTVSSRIKFCIFISIVSFVKGFEKKLDNVYISALSKFAPSSAPPFLLAYDSI
jgi:hypothetical protein